MAGLCHFHSTWRTCASPGPLWCRELHTTHRWHGRLHCRDKRVQSRAREPSFVLADLATKKLKFENISGFILEHSSDTCNFLELFRDNSRKILWKSLFLKNDFTALERHQSKIWGLSRKVRIKRSRICERLFSFLIRFWSHHPPVARFFIQRSLG